MISSNDIESTFQTRSYFFQNKFYSKQFSRNLHWFQYHLLSSMFWRHTNFWIVLPKMTLSGSENCLFCQSFTTVLLSLDCFISSCYSVSSNLKKEIRNRSRFIVFKSKFNQFLPNPYSFFHIQLN